MGDDKRNMVLAIVLSLVVLFGWQFLSDKFFPPAPAPVQQQSSSENTADQPIVGATIDSTLPETAGEAVQSIRSRSDVLTDTQRVSISTPRLEGSISLKGARIDDLTLLDYTETVDPDSPKIVLLEPSGSARPYLAQFGWIGGEGTTTPGVDAVWTTDNTTLTPDSPVTLSWTSPEGAVFQQVISLDKDYLFSVEQRVRNESGQPLTLVPYGRVFRTGTPDILGFYILHEGLIGVFNETLSEVDYDDLLEDGKIEQSTTGGWLGITDKYWLVALVPDQTIPVQTTFNTPKSANAVPRFQADFVADSVTIPAGGDHTMQSRLFAGAKKTTLLDRYAEEYGITNFDLAIDFGWFYFLTKPIFYAIHWLNEVLGNFGLAILALTVGIKAVFFPLANKSYKSMSKMKLLQPKMVELKERYGDDRQKLQMEMMALYKNDKVNPLSGCWPIMVQIPVFFALYKVLFVTIEMRHAPGLMWINDLSAPDPFGVLTLFGLIDWQVPALLSVVNIGAWPLIMGFTMWFQQKLNPAPADPIQAKVFAIMPIFFTFILASFPAGLVMYWAWNNSLSILQQWVIMKRMGVAIGGGKSSDKKSDSKDIAKAKDS